MPVAVREAKLLARLAYIFNVSVSYSHYCKSKKSYDYYIYRVLTYASYYVDAEESYIRYRLSYNKKGNYLLRLNLSLDINDVSLD